MTTNLYRLTNDLVDRNRAGEARTDLVAALDNETLAAIVRHLDTAMSMDYINLSIAASDELYNRKDA